MTTKLIHQLLNIDLHQLKAYNAGLLQGKAYNALQDVLTRTLGRFNVSIPEWKLLGQLHEHGKMRLAVLAEYLSYDPPMVTKLAKHLEKKGFVQRSADSTDERAKVISITGAGIKIVKKTEPEAKKNMAKLFKGATSEEMRIYMKVLSVIVNNSQ